MSGRNARRDEVVAAIGAVSAAAQAGDRAALDRLLAAEFTMVIAPGRRLDKAAALDLWTGSGATSSTFSIEDTEVVLSDDDLAIVTAIITDRWVVDGEQHEHVEHVFDVWRDLGDGWTFLASRPVRIDGQPS